MIHRFRIWRTKRKIDRILEHAGFPPGMHRIFTGKTKQT